MTTFLLRWLTDTHELVRIDARTNVVTLRMPVAGLASDTTVYDAAGAVWEPTSQQILRIDPAMMPG